MDVEDLILVPLGSHSASVKDNEVNASIPADSNLDH